MALLAGCSSDKFVSEDGGGDASSNPDAVTPLDGGNEGGDAATGIQWKKVVLPVPNNLGTPNLNAVWVNAADDVWVGGDVQNEGYIAHWDGAKFDRSWLAHAGLPATNALPVPSGPITSIRGASATEVVAVGSGAYRLNGAYWNSVPGASDFGGLFYSTDTNRAPPRRYFGVLTSGVVVVADADSLAVGFKDVNGSIPPLASCRGGDGFVVGCTDRLALWAFGPSTSQFVGVLQTPGVTFNAVFAFAVDDVWAVGSKASSGYLRRVANGSLGTEVALQTPPLRGVWGAGRVFAVGDGGTFVSVPTNSANDIQTATVVGGPDLRAISGVKVASKTLVWVVGAQGAVFHADLP